MRPSPNKLLLLHGAFSSPLDSCCFTEPSPPPLDFMAGRSSFSSSRPSSSGLQPSSSSARTFTKGDIRKSLGPIETKEISQEMLSVVWVLDVGFYCEKKKKNLAIHGTGFCVHSAGYILTAAHLFSETVTEILIRKIDDNFFRSSRDGHVKLIKKFDSFDVAIVKVEFSREGDGNSFNYAIFGDGNLFRGQEVINIGHPQTWVYTSVRGEVCFPCVNDVTIDYNAVTIGEVRQKEDLCTAWYKTPNYRKAADIVDPKNKKLTSYNIDIPLIQITNVHGTPGTSGSPVFNSIGLVVGMVIFVQANMDFAVHVKVLRDLLNASMENDNKHSRDKKEKKKGKRKLPWYRQ